jgi:methyl-accepting chemotaxis protein
MIWTIKTKLVMFAVAAALGLMVQTWLLMNTFDTALDLASEMAMPDENYRWSLHETVEGLLNDAQAVAAQSEQPADTERMRAIEGALLQIRERLDVASAAARGSEEKDAVLAAARAVLKLERDTTVDLHRMMAAQANSGELAQLLDRTSQHADELLSAFVELSPETISGSNPAVNELVYEVEMRTQLALTVAMVSMILMTVMMGYLGFSITVPISRMADAMNRLAKGESDVEIDLGRMDEIGQMADALRALKDRMAELEARRR